MHHDLNDCISSRRQVIEVAAAPSPSAANELGASILEAGGQRSSAIAQLTRIEDGILVPARLLHELVSHTVGLEVVSRQDGPGAARLTCQLIACVG